MKRKQRKIIHIDMDAFYASIEQRDNPEIKGKPVIVGGSANSRGVVAAASYEARKFGIHSAMPTSRAQRLCPNLIRVKLRIGYYAEVSRTITKIYKEYTDLIEPISLDECFLDVTDNKKNMAIATDIALELKRRIKTASDLTASAGVAANKFLAKIASDLNKPDGLTVVKPGQEREFLEDLPVRRIWGVGAVTTKKMNDLGIRTIGQLAQVPEDFLIKTFGKAGQLYFKMAQGKDDRPVKPFLLRKSISQERTFAQDTVDMEFLKSSLLKMAERVCEIMKKKRMVGSTIILKLRYSDFTTISRSHTIPFPVDNLEVLCSEGEKLLGKTDAGKEPVRLIGIGVSNLVDIDDILQMRLFDPIEFQQE